MAYDPFPLGQQPMSSSRGVVIASDQSPVSVTGIVTISGNSSISGTVGASVVGHAPVVIVGGSILTSSTANQSVSGTLNVGNFPTTQNVSGSVVGFQGTSPWIITGSVQTTVTTGNSSVQVLNFPANQSVSGRVETTQTGTVVTSLVSTIPSSVIVGASIFGALPAGNAVLGAVAASISGTVTTTLTGTPSVSGTLNVGNFPTTQNVSGSVVATQGTSPWIITGSVQTTVQTGNSSVQVLNFPANQSVSGRVETTQTGTVITSLVSTIPSSVLVGASIIGLTPVAISGTPNVNAAGSVVAFQGTNPWIITGSVQTTVQTGNSSVQVLNFPANQSVSGRVEATQVGTVITSLVSTVPT